MSEDLLKAAGDGKFGVFLSSGMQLIPVKDAADFLSWVEGKGALLGAEGFKYAKGGLEPQQDCIIDYSHGDASASIDFHRQIILGDPLWADIDFIDFTLAETY